MLIQFSVSNFYSIKDEATLSLEAASITEREADCVLSRGPYRLLKGAVIYGANGSGKSNLIKAYDVYTSLIRYSAENSRPWQQFVEPFRLSIDSESEPTTFEGTYITRANVTYRYGFKIKNNRILEEWLGRKKPKGREAMLFHRVSDRVTLRNFREGKQLFEKTRPNALFLSVCKQFNGPIAIEITESFGWTFRTALDPHLWGVTAYFCAKSQKNIEIVEALLKALDPGIIKITCEKSNDQSSGRAIFPDGIPPEEADDEELFNTKYKILTHHRKFNDKGEIVGEEVFDLFTNESEGTIKLFGLGFQALLAAQYGRILVVDEFDARFHPLLSKYIVGLFNSEGNKNGGQLIIATHDTNLLEYGGYRRDQIWFTEKKPTGSTDLYSLVEYKLDEDRKVRKDASFEKDYIEGRYGGIPYLGNFKNLM